MFACDPSSLRGSLRKKPGALREASGGRGVVPRSLGLVLSVRFSLGHMLLADIVGFGSLWSMVLVLVRNPRKTEDVRSIMADHNLP